MSKKLVNKTNFRAVIYPKYFCYFKKQDKQLLADCNEIKDQVKRHVDDVGYIEVECDDVYCCEFCEREWTEDNEKYNGGCCDEDEKGHIPTEADRLREENKELSNKIEELQNALSKWRKYAGGF
jgi:hypothetical protein